jgi:hypothetical protein
MMQEREKKTVFFFFFPDEQTRGVPLLAISLSHARTQALSHSADLALIFTPLPSKQQPWCDTRTEREQRERADSNALSPSSHFSISLPLSFPQAMDAWYKAVRVLMCGGQS